MANPQLSKRLQLHSLWVTSCEAEGVRLDLAGENLRNAQIPKAVSGRGKTDWCRFQKCKFGACGLYRGRSKGRRLAGCKARGG